MLPSGSYFFFRPTHGLYSIPESWSSNVGITPYPYHGNNSFDTSSTNIDLSQHMERTYPYRPSVTRPLQPLQPIVNNTQSTRYTRPPNFRLQPFPTVVDIRGFANTPGKYTPATCASKGKWFTKEETALLPSVWEEKFAGFENRKRVKKEEWLNLEREYNLAASKRFFATRSAEQIKNRVKNAVDDYKRFKDKMKSSGQGAMDKSEVEQSSPNFTVLDRVLGGRQGIDPKFILDPGNVQQPLPAETNDKKDDFNNDDDVDICGNDNDLSVDSNSDFYDLDQGPSTSKISGGSSPFPDSDNQNQENCSDLDSDNQSGVSEKLKKVVKGGKTKKPQKPTFIKKKRRRLAKSEKEPAAEQDKLLLFLKESRERDDALFVKLMDLSKESEKRQLDMTTKIVESIGKWFEKADK